MEIVIVNWIGFHFATIYHLFVFFKLGYIKWTSKAVLPSDENWANVPDV